MSTPNNHTTSRKGAFTLPDAPRLSILQIGAVVECGSAATFGMPFEVWKTRMGRFRDEHSIEAFVNVKRRAGLRGFWQGTSAKMVECSTKGAIFLFTNEAVFAQAKAIGHTDISAGFLAGGMAGLCQTLVVAPCSYVVTSVVTCQKSSKPSALKIIQETLKSSGLKGFYHGGSAVALKQASNWANRHGCTEFFRDRAFFYRYERHYDKQILSPGEELNCAMLGGLVSCWNQPFDVLRVAMQAQVNEGQPKLSLLQTTGKILSQDNLGAMFRGLPPRLLLGCWQTIFMIGIPNIWRNHIRKDKNSLFL